MEFGQLPYFLLYFSPSRVFASHQRGGLGVDIFFCYQWVCCNTCNLQRIQHGKQNRLFVLFPTQNFKTSSFPINSSICCPNCEPTSHSTFMTWNCEKSAFCDINFRKLIFLAKFRLFRFWERIRPLTSYVESFPGRTILYLISHNILDCQEISKNNLTAWSFINLTFTYHYYVATLFVQAASYILSLAI